MDKFVIRKRKASESTSDDSEDCAANNNNKTVISSKKKKIVVRKWNEEYIKYGFYMKEEEKSKILPNPTCLICPNTSLSNQAMVPNKLSRHLSKNHPTLQFKQKSYFQNLKHNKKKESATLENLVAPDRNTPLVLASLRIAHLIAVNKKPFVEAEQIIGPALKIVAEELLDKAALIKLKEIPLSNDTMTKRAELIAVDLEEQLCEKIRLSPWFGIQFDESTDVTNRAQLIGFIRFLDGEKEDIVEDFFFCEDVGVDTKGVTVANTVIGVFVRNNISILNCSQITTDGAAAMTGIRNGAVAIIKEQAPHCNSSHCDLHRENLASKPLSCGEKGPFDFVMDDAVKIINEIKASAKKTRMFTLLCEEMSEINRTLLYHCDIRWLSRGVALMRLFSLRKTVLVFLNEQKSKRATHFADDSWLTKLGYLSDVFQKLNILNRSLQGGNMDVFTARDVIEAFKLKLSMWKSRIQAGDVTDFPDLKTAFIEATDSDDKLVETTIALAVEHLNVLAINFEKYFPSTSDGYIQETKWMLNPFLKDNLSFANLTNTEQEILLELHCDSRMKEVYKQSSRTQFWSKMYKEEHYKVLASKAIKTLVAFHSSYLSEQGFSQMVNIKNKKRNKLSGGSLACCLRIALAKTIQPRFNLIQSKIQQQKSH